MRDRRIRNHTALKPRTNRAPTHTCITILETNDNLHFPLQTPHLPSPPVTTPSPPHSISENRQHTHATMPSPRVRTPHLSLGSIPLSRTTPHLNLILAGNPPLARVITRCAGRSVCAHQHPGRRIAMTFDIYLEIGMGVWCILVSVRLNGRTCVRAASVWADMVMA